LGHGFESEERQLRGTSKLYGGCRYFT